MIGLAQGDELGDRGGEMGKATCLGATTAERKVA